MTSPRGLTVHGGSTGVAADCEQIRAIAREVGDAAQDDLGQVAQLHRYLGDPAVLGCAVLDPGGAAAFEAELLLALDGPFGLVACATATGLLDGELRLAAAGYEAAEDAANRVADQIKATIDVPRALWHGGSDLLRGKLTAAGALIAYDPALIDVLDPVVSRGVAAVAERYFDDGEPLVMPLGEDERPAAVAAPRSLSDVLRGISLRDAGGHGEIDVRIIYRPDGTRAVIVDITGTKSQALSALNNDITNWGSDVVAIQGHDSVYEQGVLQAMESAGVQPGDPVMLVGHSLGGMVAANLARDAQQSKRFNVTHVVTAGAPIGSVTASVPSSVKVLALENSRDLVPRLDGRSNAGRTNVTTVSGSYGNDTVGGDHSLDVMSKDVVLG
jgi:hypothetical protein